MEQLFATQIKGEPFILFGFGHLVAVGLLLLAIVSLPLIRTHWDERGQRILRYGLITWMLGWEIAWHVCTSVFHQGPADAQADIAHLA